MYSAYPQHAGQTLNWLPMDTEILYKRNIKNNYKELNDNGWIDNKVIYRFNQQGFRSPEFTDKPSAVFLGCSHTLGLGINIEDTFGYIVSKQLNLEYVNMSLASGSLDSVFRFCNNWLPKLQAKIIVLLVPTPERFEIIEGNTIKTITSNNIRETKYNTFYKNWISNDINLQLHQEKNLLAITNLAQGTKVIKLEVANEFKKYNLDKARDLRHVGVKSHKKLSSDLIEKYIDKLK